MIRSRAQRRFVVLFAGFVLMGAGCAHQRKIASAPAELDCAIETTFDRATMQAVHRARDEDESGRKPTEVAAKSNYVTITGACVSAIRKEMADLAIETGIVTPIPGDLTLIVKPNEGEFTYGAKKTAKKTRSIASAAPCTVASAKGMVEVRGSCGGALGDQTGEFYDKFDGVQLFCVDMPIRCDDEACKVICSMVPRFKD